MFFIKPESLTDEYLFKSKAKSINIKSVVKGRVFETKSLLNIFSLIVNSTEELREDKPSQIIFQLFNLAFAVTFALLSCLGDMDIKKSSTSLMLCSAVVCLGTAASSVFDDTVELKAGSFRRCLKLLEERTRKNKELSDLGFDFAFAEREGNVETMTGVARELQMKTILTKLRQNKFRREGNKNTQVRVFEFSDFQSEKIEDVRDQVERFASEPVPQVQSSCF